MTEVSTPDPLLNRRQLADRLGVDADTVKAWDEQGRGPRRVVLGPRTVRYRASDVERWLNERSVPDPGEVA